MGRKVLSALALTLRWPPTLTLIEGGAEGYDRVAQGWARDFGLNLETYRVDAALDGEAANAPKRRNLRMYQEGRPQACVAFPGGPGTRHMWMHCHDQGIPVYDVEIIGTQCIVYEMLKGRKARMILNREFG